MSDATTGVTTGLTTGPMTGMVGRVPEGDSPLGAPLRRKEDERLLRGGGQFADDVTPGHTVYLGIARSPYPHARIARIDVERARALPGVLDVVSGAELAKETGILTVLRPVPGAPALPYYALANEVVTHEGQAVVSIVATSRAIAEDAIELLEIDYEPLPHVVDVLRATEPDAPLVQPGDLETNVLAAQVDQRGDAAAALASSEVRVRGLFRINRVSPLPMEPRAVVAEWRAGARLLTVRCSTQTPHLVRKQLAETLGMDESEIRVVADDVGGGFGQKLGLFGEEALAAFHARRLGRPVKWTEDRAEHFRASTHAREAVHDYTIGADASGRIRAMTNHYLTDLGGWNSPFGSAQLSSVVFNGPYKIHDGLVQRQVVLTNKTPVGAYRGYGQPEVNFAYERLMDRLARTLGMDPVELRAMNMVRPDDMPWTNPTGAVYDSGDYERCLRMAAAAVEWERHAATPPAHRAPRADGRIVGIGFSSFVERTGYASARFLAKRGSQFGAHESLTARANRSGGVDVYTGVSTIGQSSETAFAQVFAEVTGISYDAIRVHPGDTAATPLNTGAFASRTMIAAAGALREAGLEFAAKVRVIGAHLLEVDVETVRIAGTEIVAVNGESLPLAVVFTRAINGQGIPEGVTPGLEATSHFEPTDAAYSFGTAAAVVAVDPETGEFAVERFVLVHDGGTMVNPVIVEGQVRGGLTQALGAALGEELRYDAETGQLVNGSMMDYFVPTAADVPPIELLHTTVPSPVTPFGIRGVGEVGTIPVNAAVANAICEALADRGVELSSLPITPESVWRAMVEADASGDQAGSPAGERA